MAEEAEGYDSEESLLKVEEITAIHGSGKQLTSCITFIIEEEYQEQLVCQLDTGATCNVISHRNSTFIEWLSSFAQVQCTAKAI